MTTNVKLLVVLSKLSNVFLKELSKNLEHLGMPASTYAMLAHLNDVGRVKTQRLGEIAFISSGTITHMVNKMIQQDLVRKIQDENDKRITWIEITDAGKKAFEIINKDHMIFLDDLLGNFTEDEKIDFIEQIKYFGKSIVSKEVAK